MARLGMLFDIDQLGGGLYGYAAYKIFFETVDTCQIAGCSLSDGDTNATLAGQANQYCIAIESFDSSKIAKVRDALSNSNGKGLVTLSSRFLDNARVGSEPLVLAAHVNSGGKLVECETGWVMKAWEQSREKHQDFKPSESSTTSATSSAEQPKQLIPKTTHTITKKWWHFWK